ncbi:hypothetical protein L2D00_02130 [Hyphomonadaceae bacterium BL14]|nr:hypothetical protein L2D00_02130 [Hyphomonadaceae bacterium BL14]
MSWAGCIDGAQPVSRPSIASIADQEPLAMRAEIAELKLAIEQSTLLLRRRL